MKKMIALCSMIVALGFVTGCPGESKPPVKSETPAAEAPANPAAPAHPEPAADAT